MYEVLHKLLIHAISASKKTNSSLTGIIESKAIKESGYRNK